MARYQDRQWYVLPAPRRMVWNCRDQKIPVIVLAFSFQDDVPYWLTANSVIISGLELNNAEK